MELLLDAHFWVGVAFVAFVGIIFAVGGHKFGWQALGDAGAKVRAQLDEAHRLRSEAEALLANIKAEREQAERHAAELLAEAKEQARRMQAEAEVRLAEQIQRRGQLAERRIAVAEAQATADVKAAAADLAAQMAEQVLTTRLAGAKSDPLIDQALGQLGSQAFSRQ